MSEPARTGRLPNFTRDEDAWIVGWFALGLTSGQIAIKVGRDAEQIRQRVRWLGFKRHMHYHKSVTPADLVKIPFLGTVR